MSTDSTTNNLIGASGTAVSLLLSNVNTFVSIVAGIATAIYMSLCAYHKWQDCKERRKKAAKEVQNQP